MITTTLKIFGVYLITLAFTLHAFPQNSITFGSNATPSLPSAAQGFLNTLLGQDPILPNTVDSGLAPVQPPLNQTANLANNSNLTAVAVPPITTQDVGALGIFANGKEQPTKRSCYKQCVRQEITTWTAAEFIVFANAMKILNTPRAGETTSWFANLVSIHNALSAEVHGNDNFLHWHRYYLLILERKLQTIDPSICMPYWDWPNSSQNFTAHPVFTTPFLSTQDANGCIPTGPFAQWTVFNEIGCVQRNINTTYTLTSYGITVALLHNTQNFTSFRNTLEVTPHSGPHIAIGGSMATMLSPADPLFWLHHATVDMLWSDLTYKTTGLQHPALATPLPGFLLTLGDVDHAEDWCYSYAPTPLNVETKVAPPSPISSTFLKMNQNINSTAAVALSKQISAKVANATVKFQNSPTDFTAVTTRSSNPILRVPSPSAKNAPKTTVAATMLLLSIVLL